MLTRSIPGAPCGFIRKKVSLRKRFDANVTEILRWTSWTRRFIVERNVAEGTRISMALVREHYYVFT